MEYKYEQGSKSGCNLEDIVAKHTGLVKSIALRLSHVYGEEAEDLIQIGYIGLIKAAERFDPERGYRFSTYAVPLIAGEIKSQIRDRGLIKVSRSLKSDAAVIRNAENMFLSEKGRSPKLSELSEITGFSLERVTQAVQAADAVSNIEEFDKPEIIDSSVSTENEEDLNVTRMDLASMISGLEPKARQIMILRYYKDMTQSQVAKMIGISQVQVCRIERKSLKIMSEKITF